MLREQVKELAAITNPRNLGLHVDNCLGNWGVLLSDVYAPKSDYGMLPGGFYLSYLQKQGLFKRKFDFSVRLRECDCGAPHLCTQSLPLFTVSNYAVSQVNGVTSISIDVHKYGYAPKGVSVVAFAQPHLRRLTVRESTLGSASVMNPFVYR